MFVWIGSNHELGTKTEYKRLVLTAAKPFSTLRTVLILKPGLLLLCLTQIVANLSQYGQERALSLLSES